MTTTLYRLRYEMNEMEIGEREVGANEEHLYFRRDESGVAHHTGLVFGAWRLTKADAVAAGIEEIREKLRLLEESRVKIERKIGQAEALLAEQP